MTCEKTGGQIPPQMLSRFRNLGEEWALWLPLGRETVWERIRVGKPLSRVRLYAIRGILQPSILEWVSHAHLQEIFPIQGWNPGLPHCRRILYQLGHKAALGGRLNFYPTFFEAV